MDTPLVVSWKTGDKWVPAAPFYHPFAKCKLLQLIRRHQCARNHIDAAPGVGTAEKIVSLIIGRYRTGGNGLRIHQLAELNRCIRHRGKAAENNGLAAVAYDFLTVRPVCRFDLCRRLDAGNQQHVPRAGGAEHADDIAHIRENTKLVGIDVQTPVQLAIAVFVRIGDSLIDDLGQEHGDEHMLCLILFREGDKYSHRLRTDFFDGDFRVVADDALCFGIDKGKQAAHGRCHNRGKLCASGLRCRTGKPPDLVVLGQIIKNFVQLCAAWYSFAGFVLLRRFALLQKL